MPDHEQLWLICLLGLLGVLYVIGLIIRFVTLHWYEVAAAITVLVALRVWWRRRHPVYLDDDEDEWEPVPQE